MTDIDCEVFCLNNYYIKFGSVTYAQLAQETLRRNGIRSRVGKNTNPNRKQGCNYALFIDGDAQTAYRIIMRENIKNLGLERGMGR